MSGELNIFTIILRRYLYIFFTGLKKLYSLITSSPESLSSVIFYPPFDDISDLHESVNKACFAFPLEDIRIIVPLGGSIETTNIDKVNPPDYQFNFIDQNCQVVYISENEIAQHLKTSLILFRNFKGIFRMLFSKNLSRSFIVDKNFYSFTEGMSWQNAFYHTISKSDKNFYSQLSRNNYERFLMNNQGKHRAIIFLTGPSIDRYKDFHYNSDDIKIICNSIVRNDSLLEHIGGPDLITFADPVFHFGASKYSETFRQHVLEVVKRYKSYVMVPAHSIPLLHAHYPELNDFIIGMDWKSGKFNFPVPDNFWVKDTDNILSFLMIPVASALTDKIFIIGADGRSQDENYFWKFSGDSQFDDLMDSVFSSHISFFRDRKYADYYSNHCKLLEDLITFGEDKGKEYFSFTESNIPALKQRIYKEQFL